MARISPRITSLLRRDDVIRDEIRAIATYMLSQKHYNFDVMQLCIFYVANAFIVFAFKAP